jgi:hypothetical protein
LFKDINWDDVTNRRIRPSFQLADPNQSHLDNFDEEFTHERAMDSFVVPVIDLNARLPGFSFEGSPIIKPVSHKEKEPEPPAESPESTSDD